MIPKYRYSPQPQPQPQPQLQPQPQPPSAHHHHQQQLLQQEKHVQNSVSTAFPIFESTHYLSQSKTTVGWLRATKSYGTRLTIFGFHVMQNRLAF